MHTKLIKLEKAFNDLLPPRQLHQSPPKELIEAARAWSEEVWRISKDLGPLPLSDQQISNGKTLIQHPVFICGVHRSGTSLLRDLLDGHPSLTVLPSEGTFFTNIASHLQRMPPQKHEVFLATEWLRRLANPINQPPYWLLGESTATTSPYVDYARAFSAWYAIAEKELSAGVSTWPHFAVILAYATCGNESVVGLDARYWVDKTPANEKHLQKIWREMPGAKIIQMIRSPADVLLSRKRMEPGLDIDNCIKEMQLSYQTAIEQSQINKDRYLVVRYEDLIEYPKSAMSEITRFLDMEDLPVLYNPTVVGKAANVNSSFHSGLPAGSIIKPQANHNGLESQESDVLAVYLAKPASQLGYSLKPVKGFKSWLVKLKFEWRYGIFYKIFRKLARHRH